MALANENGRLSSDGRPLPFHVKLHSIGAIPEGVFVRTDHWSIAVRRRHDGTLIAARGRVDPLTEGAGSWPLIRGIVCQFRQWYPPFAVFHWEDGILPEGPDDEHTAPPLDDSTFRQPPTSSAIFEWTDLPPRAPTSLVSSVIRWSVGVMLLIALPQFVVSWTLRHFGVDASLRSVAFQIATGLMLLVLFVLYAKVIARLPEVRRVIQYNSAALKVLVACEKRLPLTLDYLRRLSPLHPRSSVNYLMFMMFLLPVAYYFVGQLVPETGDWFAHGIFITLKIIAVPCVYAFSYEMIEGAGELFVRGRLDSVWQILCCSQRLWILEPEDEQIELARIALEEAIALETGFAIDDSFRVVP